MTTRLLVGGQAWTCWTCGCAEQDEDASAFCPKCGGMLVRPVQLTGWQRVQVRIRRRFDTARTFNTADELIEWLEEED